MIPMTIDYNNDRSVEPVKSLLDQRSIFDFLQIDEKLFWKEICLFINRGSTFIHATKLKMS